MYCIALQWRYMDVMAFEITGNMFRVIQKEIIRAWHFRPFVSIAHHSDSPQKTVGNATSALITWRHHREGTEYLRSWVCVSCFAWTIIYDIRELNDVNVMWPLGNKWPRFFNKCTEVKLWIRFYCKCVRRVWLRGHNVAFVSCSTTITIVDMFTI